jgi:hypothetical protein
MVHDDNVRLHGLLPHERQEAAAETLVAAGIDAGPELEIVADIPEFRAIAGLGLAGPFDDFLECREFLRREEAFRELAVELQAARIGRSSAVSRRGMSL